MTVNPIRQALLAFADEFDCFTLDEATDTTHSDLFGTTALVGVPRATIVNELRSLVRSGLIVKSAPDPDADTIYRMGRIQ